MELRILHTEAGFVSLRMESCCTSTSTSFLRDGSAAGMGFRLQLGIASMRNLKRRKVSCLQGGTNSGSKPEFWRRRRYFPCQEVCGGRIGDSKLSVSRFRVSALDESDPLGPGYWDGAEGKQQMAEIEDMKELIAEAERLKKASRTEAETAEEREERARQDAARLREQLAERAREQAERRKTAEKMYQLGQTAYARGMYDKSVELFEGALVNVQGTTNLGGEIQIWLAMAYDANNRHDDCIALYKRLEARHPNKQIKRQAADLRYILEAPKLKISREEMNSKDIHSEAAGSQASKGKIAKREGLPRRLVGIRTATSLGTQPLLLGCHYCLADSLWNCSHVPRMTFISPYSFRGRSQRMSTVEEDTLLIVFLSEYNLYKCKIISFCRNAHRTCSQYWVIRKLQ